MKQLTRTAAVAAVCVAAAVCSKPSLAAPIVFDFTSASSTVNLGSSEPYTVGGVTITAYSGFLSGSTITRTGVLVGNNRGSDEKGLGVCSGDCNRWDYADDPEIDASPREVVQLDISNLLAAGYNSLKVNADSATSTESLVVYGNAAASSLGTLRAQITSADGDVAVTQNGNFLNFVSSANSLSNDVLLHSLTADKVNTPEPASLAVLAVGLAGLGFTKRRSKTRVSAVSHFWTR